MPDGMMDRGTMGGGMMGMMDMMERCDRMMDGAAAGLIPQLLPGNEKLHLQMQAEIMQSVGKILAKYAERVKDGTGSAR